MADQSEREQIELFTKWWNENGTVLTVTVGLVLAGYFGWITWQKNQQTRMEKASALYQQLLEEKDKSHSLTGVIDQANELKKDYGNTFYGQAVHLLLAEEAVKSSNLETAQKELEALVAKKADEKLLLTAQFRLARVLYAQGQYDAALLHLPATVPDAYQSLYAELRGDILVAQGKPTDARAAYQEAKKATKDKKDVAENTTLDMKLNSLGAP